MTIPPAAIAHNDATRELLAKTTPLVREFIQRRGYQLNLYPLDFLRALIIDAEWLECAAAIFSDQSEGR